jgi:prophage regulatory protein
MRTFIRLPEVMRITGLGKSTIYSGMDQGYFPKCFSLGKKSVGWDLQEILAYQEQCMARRYEPPTKRQKSALDLLGGELNL